MRRFLREINDDEAELVAGDWPTWARLNQLPTRDGLEIAEFGVWLVLGGRGAGKTRCGAEWVGCQAQGLLPLAAQPIRRIALVGPTIAQVRAVMVEGVSGLLSIPAYGERPHFEPSLKRLVWDNGTIAEMFSAEQPDSLRGPQFDAAWCDELAKWRHPDATWDMLQFALRLGAAPKVVVTTTPRPIPLLKRLMADAATLVTRTPTADNHRFLAPGFLRDIKARYGGTRLGRQELEAEIIDDDPGALFRRDLIEASRDRSVPDLVRIVVAVDPPATGGARANACGIVCAGLGRDGRAYVLDDATVERASPSAWAKRAVALYHARQADRLIAEVNQGGDMVEAVIREIDPAVSFKAVHAWRGKRLRAEPVAALYEQGRVVHVGVFPELEDELVSFEGHAQRSTSPDRADALVWALTELMLRRHGGEPRLRRV